MNVLRQLEVSMMAVVTPVMLWFGMSIIWLRLWLSVDMANKMSVMSMVIRVLCSNYLSKAVNGQRTSVLKGRNSQESQNFGINVWESNRNSDDWNKA